MGSCISRGCCRRLFEESLGLLAIVEILVFYTQLVGLQGGIQGRFWGFFDFQDRAGLPVEGEIQYRLPRLVEDGQLQGMPGDVGGNCAEFHQFGLLG